MEPYAILRSFPTQAILWLRAEILFQVGFVCYHLFWIQTPEYVFHIFQALEMSRIFILTAIFQRITILKIWHIATKNPSTAAQILVVISLPEILLSFPAQILRILINFIFKLTHLHNLSPKWKLEHILLLTKHIGSSIFKLFLLNITLQKSSAKFK